MKNAGLNEKNGEYKHQRKESFAGMDRYFVNIYKIIYLNYYH